jgi:hypothetical protein
MRWSVVGLAVPVLLVVGAVAAYAYDRSREGVIGEGVRIGGVVVGGMSADEAAEAVRAWHERSLRRPVVVGGGPRRFVFPRPRGIRASTSLVLSTRRSRQSTGELPREDAARGRRRRAPDVALEPRVNYSWAAVERFIDRVARRGVRTARNASVKAWARSVRIRPGRSGLALRRQELRRALDRALLQRGVARELELPIKSVRSA